VKVPFTINLLGYRDDSLETVKRNEQQYDIPLKIFSYKELYGWTMDEIVREVSSAAAVSVTISFSLRILIFLLIENN